MIEAMNGLNVLMPRVLVAVPLEPIWVDDPVEPWEGMIPAQQGALLRAANHPDGFADPYKSLSLMSQSHVRLYWLSCVARASLIAADELNAFVWMDRWDDNAVAGAYTNNEPEHHKARELFLEVSRSLHQQDESRSQQPNGLSTVIRAPPLQHTRRRVVGIRCKHHAAPVCCESSNSKRHERLVPHPTQSLLRSRSERDVRRRHGTWEPN